MVISGSAMYRFCGFEVEFAHMYLKYECVHLAFTWMEYVADDGEDCN